MKNINFCNETDAILISKFMNGNNLAFDALVIRHEKAVRDHIRTFVKDYDLCEEFFQQAFLKAMAALRSGKYSDNGTFVAWVKTIAKNIHTDYTRLARTKRTRSLDQMESDAPDVICNSLDEKLKQEEDLDRMHDLIDKLPLAQKEIIKMRLAEISFKEIAERKKISINTALGRMRYAVKNLQNGFGLAA